MNLVRGAWDSLSLLTFKWQTVKPRNSRWWLLVALALVGLLLIFTAFSGTIVRDLVSMPANNQQTRQLQESVLLWLNIFMAENASFAMSAMLWTLVISILLIPLVGYSFASLMPEGDLASIQVTEYHKMFDSILIQFTNSISFIQILTITGLSSLLTLGNDDPGLGIVSGWMLWLVSVFLTVLSAWTFEYLHRRWGVMSKVIVVGIIGIVLIILFFGFQDQVFEFFGLAPAYTQLVQGMSFENPEGFFLMMGISTVMLAVFVMLISWVGTKTLQIQERPRKQNANSVLLSRLGLVKFNKVSGMTQFLLRLVTRQTNIWKPLLLASGFAALMIVIFFNFNSILFTLSMLIPIMITLVWSINIFGILGSGSTWLVSLPESKQKLLVSVKRVQYLIAFLIASVLIALCYVFYEPEPKVMLNFIIWTICNTLVITQFALEKSVYAPNRYRVHIRGESVLPPNKAFGYLVLLFLLGAITTGACYVVGSLPFTAIFPGLLPELNIVLQFIAQLLFVGLIYLITFRRFSRLQYDWLYRSEVLQQIVKTVGAQN